MSTEELEAEALRLDPISRARLAEKLLRSLEDLSEEENSRLWADEAARRNARWDSATSTSSDEVFRAARSSS